MAGFKAVRTVERESDVFRRLSQSIAWTTACLVAVHLRLSPADTEQRGGEESQGRAGRQVPAHSHIYPVFLKQNIAKWHLHVMHFVTQPSHETTVVLTGQQLQSNLRTTRLGHVW
jgi:hypothetical protein